LNIHISHYIRHQSVRNFIGQQASPNTRIAHRERICLVAFAHGKWQEAGTRRQGEEEEEEEEEGRGGSGWVGVRRRGGGEVAARGKANYEIIAFNCDPCYLRNGVAM